MEYQIFVQSKKDNFVASVIGIPNVIVEASTESEAISKVKTALEAQLATGKFVTIEVNPKEFFYQKTTKMKYAGIFANDPTFDDLMEKLAVIRKESKFSYYLQKSVTLIFKGL
ncbi:MAG: type II toxin-antitoxin system HicB family antitoxin [Scytonematopsis contorta HA4267-MV1]|jgi:predicted RNase H-like HicB family nuclease|nr:type II toxin-antitoxin system HicB family antitoxin [Scytonematopsis contorta HA4267-MV1]